jgi:MFS superfamily sulfate permease-like transporter
VRNFIPLLEWFPGYRREWLRADLIAGLTAAAVAIGIAATALFGLQQHGVATVGHIPQGLPPVVFPDLALLGQLWPGALGIALMSFAETTAAARAFAASGEPRPDANQELLATGLSNIGGGLFGAMAAGGGTTQTAVRHYLEGRETATR